MTTPKRLPPDAVLPNDEYKKLVFQLRGQVSGVLQIFNGYGLGEYIPYATNLIVELAENFGQAVRGDNEKPIHIIGKPCRRPLE